MPQPVHRNLAGAMARCLEESSEPLRGAFLARALNALARLAPQLEERELGEAAAAPSDYAVLVSALGKPEAIAVVQQDDPLAEARVRGLEMRERLLRAEGGALTSELVGRRLGITRQAVDKRRRAGRLLAFSTGRRGYVYPLWQFGPEGVLPGFGLVLADLAVCDPWMQAAFFLSGDARLGGMTPLEALRKGEVDDVRRAARGYGEHSAV
ncbi:MAG: hypothetical protein HY690_10405 [Chloroflexi bacterium]|nr:hypothetical protein [Chloroflexota bacterium]